MTVGASHPHELSKRFDFLFAHAPNYCSWLIDTGVTIFRRALSLDVFYLKAISVSGFDFPGDYLTVALGCKVLKAHKAALAIHNIVISLFDGIFLAREILVHLFEKS